MLKSYGWGGGPCDFSASPSPFGLDFGTLDFGLGLDNILPLSLSPNIFDTTLVHPSPVELILKRAFFVKSRCRMEQIENRNVVFILFRLLSEFDCDALHCTV